MRPAWKVSLWHFSDLTRTIGNVCSPRDIVAEVFLGGRTKFFSAADTFYERRREGPYRFIQNRSGISVVALKSSTAAEKSKDQLSRDFPGRSIFDFCNIERLLLLLVGEGVRTPSTWVAANESRESGGSRLPLRGPAYFFWAVPVKSGPRPSMPAESRLATSSPLGGITPFLSPTRQGGGKFDIGQWPA